jgi:phage N-6-adenine-methyltransferase
MPAMTTDEILALRGYEDVIERGRRTFIEVGGALMEVRDRKLYRETHGTFEDYVQARWDFSWRHAYRLIEAADVAQNLTHGTGLPAPDTERQARAIAAVEPEQRADVWREAVIRNHGQPAPARLVAEVAAELNPDALAPVRRNDPAAIAQLMPKRNPVAAVEVAAVPVRDGDEWFTPEHIIKAARRVLGGIDLDPASCSAANTIVGALLYYSPERGTDGLEMEWWARAVWLNPPYSDTGRWVEKLITEHQAGRVQEAIVLVNAKTETAWFDLLFEHASICFIRGRLSFVAGDGGDSSTGRCGSVAAYLGQPGPMADLFRDVFGELGRVVPRGAAVRSADVLPF